MQILRPEFGHSVSKALISGLISAIAQFQFGMNLGLVTLDLLPLLLYWSTRAP